MSKGFKFSLIIIILVVVVLLFSMFPNNSPENSLTKFFVTLLILTLPFLLIVMLVKNFSRKTRLDYPNENVSKNWIHTLRLTFQFMFSFSVFVSVAMIIYMFFIAKDTGPEGLLPFAILIFISAPTLLISIIFSLVEKK